LSENIKIDSLNVVFFQKFFEKVKAMCVNIKLILNSEEIKSHFNENTHIETFLTLQDALPSDININDIKNLKKLGAEDLKFFLPVVFNNGIPIINLYMEPSINQIDELDKDLSSLIDYNKFRAIIDFHNIHSVPARFAGVLIKYQSKLTLKHSGKIELIIKSQDLTTQLKEGGFLNKFEIFEDFDKAMEHINL